MAATDPMESLKQQVKFRLDYLKRSPLYLAAKKGLFKDKAVDAATFETWLKDWDCSEYFPSASEQINDKELEGWASSPITSAFIPKELPHETRPPGKSNQRYQGNRLPEEAIRFWLLICPLEGTEIEDGFDAWYHFGEMTYMENGQLVTLTADDNKNPVRPSGIPRFIIFADPHTMLGAINDYSLEASRDLASCDDVENKWVLEFNVNTPSAHLKAHLDDLLARLTHQGIRKPLKRFPLQEHALYPILHYVQQDSHDLLLKIYDLCIEGKSDLQIYDEVEHELDLRPGKGESFVDEQRKRIAIATKLAIIRNRIYNAMLGRFPAEISDGDKAKGRERLQAKRSKSA
jgi:hypothetical protein